jgi:hypothetical protein
MKDWIENLQIVAGIDRTRLPPSSGINNQDSKMDEVPHFVNRGATI